MGKWLDICKPPHHNFMVVEFGPPMRDMKYGKALALMRYIIHLICRTIWMAYVLFIIFVNTDQLVLYNASSVLSVVFATLPPAPPPLLFCLLLRYNATIFPRDLRDH